MSAFVVTAEHIATCAEIIKKTTFKYHSNPPTDAEIRTELALANVASVAWRYGEEGQAAYAPLLGFITEGLTQAGWGTESQVVPPKTTDDVDKACFCDGYTWMQFLEDCRTAAPVSYTAAEGYQYLSCFSYQSCEPPEWKASKVNEWVLEAQDSLAHQLVERELGERHVWVVDRAA